MAFGASLALHVILLAALGMIKFSSQLQVFTTITSEMENDEDPTSYKLDSTTSDQLGSDSDINSFASSQEAAMQISKDPQEQIEQTIAEDLEVPNLPTEELSQPAKADVLASVATTGATEHPGGVEGAVDRLAWEIANSLREKKTLVVWLFDVSPSLSGRRAVIADRVENVYKQLNALNVNSDKALKSAVAVFGERTNILTKDPIDDTAELVKTVHGIKSEASGNENTFAAVTQVARHFQKYRTEMHRDIMIIIVTDEAGSDAPQFLETAIASTKRYGMRCYCVGDAAPFGRETTEAPFTLESGETVIGVMHRGPETLYPETLRLAYWGTNDYELQNMSSGYGPYALTRLCAETNGLYLIASEGRGRNFDPQVMRNYAPDYRPIPMIDREFNDNKAKSVLRDVARLLKVENVPLPRLDFPAENDNVLRVAITEAQKSIVEFEYKINQLKLLLEPGEKDRAKIKDARSKAGFDLAMGRVLALQARSYGYNMMLAEMKSSPRKFEKPGSNQWKLEPSSEINSGATTKKLATKAAEYLKRVIDDHPGTPWQQFAEKEYGIPMGWKWRESHYDPNGGGMGNGKNKPGPKFLEVEDPLTKKKKKVMITDDPKRRDI
ncbi:MAG: VWA domain-containing protein [Planctomycetes bacterium]|nr:VWA domain-containing protein [Planctomycetota bacterium]